VKQEKSLEIRDLVESLFRVTINGLNCQLYLAAIEAYRLRKSLKIVLLLFIFPKI